MEEERMRRLGPLRRALMRLGTWLLLGLASLAAAAPCSADISGLYARADMEKATPRLAGLVKKLYEIGMKPYLSADERAKLGEFDLQVPLPAANDPALDFYASEEGG